MESYHSFRAQISPFANATDPLWAKLGAGSLLPKSSQAGVSLPTRRRRLSVTVVDDQADNLEDLGGGGLLLAPQQILPHARQADATILCFRGRDHLPVVRRSAEAKTQAVARRI
jgi:hypothetical protein